MDIGGAVHISPILIADCGASSSWCIAEAERAKPADLIMPIMGDPTLFDVALPKTEEGFLGNED